MESAAVYNERRNEMTTMMMIDHYQCKVEMATLESTELIARLAVKRISPSQHQVRLNINLFVTVVVSEGWREGM